MRECSFCKHYNWRKKHEIKGVVYKYETSLIARFDSSRSVEYFKKLRFCPECGKELGMESKQKPTTAEAAVDVVRCKECIYWRKAKTNSKGFLICPASGMEIMANDFCSYGERTADK